MVFSKFYSHSTDEHGNLSSSGTAVPLKFDTWHLLENYIKSVYYYNADLMTLMYFQMQFMKVHCTGDAKSAIKDFLNDKELKDLSYEKQCNLL